MTDLVVHQRWHTVPPSDGFDRPALEPKKVSLGTLVMIDSPDPFYWLLSEAASNGALPAAQRTWLQSLVQVFDIYVTRRLHQTHAEPWEGIIQDYQGYYGDPTPSIARGGERAMMARLLSWNEVKEVDNQGLYAYDVHPPPSLTEGDEQQDCAGESDYKRHDPYGMEFQGPYNQKPGKLDPMHHWGYYATPTARLHRACCTRPANAEGCWISIVPGQPMGIVLPYQVLLQNYWPALATNWIPGQGIDFTADLQVGTAFVLDLNEHHKLNREIQSLWRTTVAPLLADVYARYMAFLDDRILLGEPLDFQPYQRYLRDNAEIKRLYTLLKAYNEIQCGTYPDQVMTYFVNEQLFKVSSLAREWTMDKRGGVEGKNGLRVRLLVTSPPNLESLLRFKKELTAAFPLGGVIEKTEVNALLKLAQALIDVWADYQFSIDERVLKLVDDIVNDGAYFDQTSANFVAVARYRDRVFAAQTDLSEVMLYINGKLKEARQRPPMTAVRKASTFKIGPFPNPDDLDIVRMVAYVRLRKDVDRLDGISTAQAYSDFLVNMSQATKSPLKPISNEVARLVRKNPDAQLWQQYIFVNRNDIKQALLAILEQTKGYKVLQQQEFDRLKRLEAEMLRLEQLAKNREFLQAFVVQLEKADPVQMALLLNDPSWASDAVRQDVFAILDAAGVIQN